MQSVSWMWHALCLLLFLGCASPEGVAQDSQPAGSEERASNGKEAAPRLQAKLHEKGQEKPFVLTKVVLFVPEVSLFGSSSGEESDTLLVRRGAAEIEVPVAEIARLEVGEKSADDRLELTIHLRAQEGEEASPPLSGTVQGNLQLRGSFESYPRLNTLVKLRDLKSVELEEMG